MTLSDHSLWLVKGSFVTESADSVRQGWEAVV